MNVERLTELSSFLKTLKPESFNMWRVYSTMDDGYSAYEPSLDSDKNMKDMFSCGTAACIAGWAIAKWPQGLPSFHNHNFVDLMAPCLDLTDVQANDLGNPDGVLIRDPKDQHNMWAMEATPAQAANVIDHFIKTGVVNWGKANTPVENLVD